MICPTCGTSYSDGVRYCPRDGTALVDPAAGAGSPGAGAPLRCPTCDARYPAGERYCPRDGAKLTAA
ncbi:MAG TPA: zinc ribbon domain-containing protein [Gemmatimonadaceae bacterium]|nr:zinc ribbon domain-containing protein [Gemmatimonadaceae bacterium]